MHLRPFDHYRFFLFSAEPRLFICLFSLYKSKLIVKFEIAIRKSEQYLVVPRGSISVYLKEKKRKV